MFTDLSFRLRAILHRGRVEAELREEIEAHLEYEKEKYLRAGMAVEDAGRAAAIALGGAEQIRQQCRDARGTQRLENFVLDVRYGTRSLARSPGFGLVVVFTLALGIAACTAVFSLIDVVLYPKLPYADAQQLVYLFTPNPLMADVPPDAIPPTSFFFDGIRRASRSFSSMTQFQQLPLQLEHAGSLTPLGGAMVDAGFFFTLGVRPILGRVFHDSDEPYGAHQTAVISYSLWQQQFGGDVQVIGKPIRLHMVRQTPDARNGHASDSYLIAGVMPAGFRFPRVDEVDYGYSNMPTSDVWLPLAQTSAQRTDDSLGDFYALARLRPGVTASEAQVETATLVDRLNRVEPVNGLVHGGWQAYVKPFYRTLTGDARPLLHLLMGAVGFVLLIACSNAASLLLARNAGRTHELSVRATLGAGRGRLMQQMLTESMLLATAGGVVSIGLAWFFLKVLLRLDPGNIPRLHQASLNPRVLVFAIMTTLLTSIAMGILPALSSSRGDLVSLLKSGGIRGAVGNNHRLRSALISGEVALVVILLAGAGLLIRSFLKVEAVPKGFSTATLSMKIELPPAYMDDAKHHAFFETLLESIRAIPGVRAAGANTSLPLSHNESVGTFWVQDYANEKGQMVSQASVSPEYFRAMGTPLLAGREFRANDRAAVIVNEAFVKKYFAGRNPLGKWIRQSAPDGGPGQPAVEPSIVVGVTADARHTALEQPAQPALFSPLQNADSAFLAILAGVPPADILPALRTALNKLDPSLALTDVQTMSDRVSEALALRRFQTVLLSVFSTMALALALVGLYGLLAYTARQRKQEIGIRIAVGASRRDVLMLVAGQGVRLVLAGLAVGLAGALALQHLLSSFLFGVTAMDPLTFFLVPGLLLITALGACAAPAWRAANIDPVHTLRYE
jgi:predicted permease